MDKIMGVVRTVAAAAAGFLVAMGWVQSTDAADFVTNIETILGAVGTAAVAVASIYAKVKLYTDKAKS